MFLQRTIGAYELLSVLDTGGMGRVYLARARVGSLAGRLVVVKTIRSELEQTTDLVRSFQREAQLLAHLRHPNIVQLYDADREGQRFYIVMEYLEGLDLAKILALFGDQGRRIPLEIVVHVGLQVARALESAHAYTSDDGKQAGLVHRDLSPHNVFLLYTGSVKLLDFGLARAYGAPGSTRTGMVKGKFRYLAPEQARGEPLDARVDIFALGLVLHELITGQRAYRQTGELDVLRAAMVGQFQRLGELDRSLPGPLVRVVERAVRTDRNERYPSAFALAEDLKQAAAELGLYVPEDAPEHFMSDVKELARLHPPPPHASYGDSNDDDVSFGRSSPSASVADVFPASARPVAMSEPWRIVWFWTGGVGLGMAVLLVVALTVLRPEPWGHEGAVEVASTVSVVANAPSASASLSATPLPAESVHVPDAVTSAIPTPSATVPRKERGHGGGKRKVGGRF